MHDSKEAPCHGCTDRSITCHSECDKYKEWKTEYDRKLDAYNKKTSFIKDLIGYDLQTNNALKKRARWGKRGRH